MIGSINVPGASAADIAVINNTLNDKVDKIDGKGLSTEDYTTEEKTKLAGLSNITVDDALSTTSTNPVQNKAVTDAIAEVQNWIEEFKLSSGLRLSSYSAEMLQSVSVQINVDWSSDGTLSVESSNTDIAAVSFSGDTITITGGASSGTATITVSVNETEYYQAGTATISVTNQAVAKAALKDNTPAQIRAAAQAGIAANLWSVGDKIGIPLSGTVGILTLSGTYYAFILGFNHNPDIEGDKSIHFALGMASNGTRIAFCDSKYASYESTSCFNMNTSNTTVGGWKSSQMRTTIIPAFKALLPAEWQSVISPCTKYSDNIGGGSNTPSYVTNTRDDLFLLSEFEVWGEREGANSAEQLYQKQYAYFANGNWKVFYNHSDLTSTCVWWLRSVVAVGSDFDTRFCNVNAGGVKYSNDASRSVGLVPCFKVA